MEELREQCENLGDRQGDIRVRAISNQKRRVVFFQTRAVQPALSIHVSMFRTFFLILDSYIRPSILSWVLASTKGKGGWKTAKENVSQRK